LPALQLVNKNILEQDTQPCCSTQNSHGDSQLAIAVDASQFNHVASQFKTIQVSQPWANIIVQSHRGESLISQIPPSRRPRPDQESSQTPEKQEIRVPIENPPFMHPFPNQRERLKYRFEETPAVNSMLDRPKTIKRLYRECVMRSC
jgi:hypothetical protein